MDFILSFLPKTYNTLEIDAFTIIQTFCWFIAAAVSFYFSMDNARIWTSIAIGFFLVFWSLAYQLNPFAQSYYKLTAIHYTIGTIAILLISHGFQEYFVFTRTLEITGSKMTIYLTTLGLIVAASIIISLNPKPSIYVLRNYKMMNNTVWFFLSCINIYTIFKIYRELKGSPIANGILSFALVFFFALIWKGSGLYLALYQWDKEWLDIIDFTGESTDIAQYAAQVEFAQFLSRAGVLMSGLSAGGTFVYLFKLLR
ncbi:MAG: hypothetical protein HGB32_11210 [Geobacteraceae bacterium]|nr:hypothetical protein [Geobacteraceae bacterium]NTW80703.1 hypothetical protein [Geobacteraceae bacterium]